MSDINYNQLADEIKRRREAERRTKEAWEKADGVAEQPASEPTRERPRMPDGVGLLNKASIRPGAKTYEPDYRRRAMLRSLRERQTGEAEEARPRVKAWQRFIHCHYAT